MARYRKIEVRIWNDEKFRSLSDRGKLAFLFILTHPHMTSLGAMRATMAGLAAELGWTEKGFREGFAEPFQKGLLVHDESACFIGLPNFVKHNPPENPNVVKSWRDVVELIPECTSKDQLLYRIAQFTKGLGKGFGEALPEPFRKGMPNPEPEPEPEPEQEQEQDTDSCTEPSEADAAVPELAPLMTFPIVSGKKNDPKTWPLYADRVADYQECYPGIDALAEAKKARQWCIDNKSKRKTAGGMPRFLNNWMAGAQDDSAKRSAGTKLYRHGGNSSGALLDREFDRESRQLETIRRFAESDGTLHED